MTHSHNAVAHRIRISLPPPPPFVLITSAVLVLIFALVAGNFGDAPSVAAQTTPTPVDYDIDDDGLIDIRTHAQFLAMDEDRNGDGNPDPGQNAGIWNAAFPNPAAGRGCRSIDHDNDAMSAEVPRCTGYEMLNDLDFTGRSFTPIAWRGFPWGVNNYNAIFKGNGYRVIRPLFSPPALADRQGRGKAVFNGIGSNGRVEGLGVVSPDWQSAGTGAIWDGGIVGVVQGTIIGSYVVGMDANIARNANYTGGLAGRVESGGLVVNSYAVTRAGWPGQNAGGLVGQFTNGSSCRNSYFSGENRGSTGGLLARTRQVNTTITNCVGDTTTDSNTGHVWQFASAQQNMDFGATNAEMVAVTGYDNPAMNPFSAWNTDEDNDGEPDDVWDFGDETTLPVLKGYGHDRTLARARPAQYSVVDAQGMITTPADSVNLCTRTIAVANEIIRHLQDSDWRTTDPAITAVPADVASLTPCTSLADTRSVSVDHLRDFVVTSEANPFRLNPGRTTPASDRLSALHGDDLAYLPNAGHFDFSGNALTAIPVRIFQGLKVLQLDLSNNAITGLHADTFADITAAGMDEATGNFLNLDNNRITSTGLPDRVFDNVPHMNGISLRSNALTTVNTRWFQSLGNLGRRATGDTMLRPYLGLQLGGNAITEHYYWQRAFGDFRMDRVEYTGTDAGASLLAATRAQMQEVNTDITNLDLESTYHLANGALRSGNCPSGLTSGPPGSLDLQGNPVQCLVAASWTPPWQEGMSVRVGSATAASTAASITISFSHIADLGITAYQVRYRKLTNDPGAAWAQQWRIIPVDLSAAGAKTFTLDGLERDTTYQFQIRAISNGVPGPARALTHGTTATLPTVNKIQPTIREISVQAGQQIRLAVDVYGRQDDLNNDLADDAAIVFRWSENPSSGGIFASPSSGRRVTYTAPSLPGTYTVTAEAQPDGVCASHHNSRTTITAADRAPCIATFTIRVSRAPGIADPEPDPVNPAGLIPTSLTDDDGVAYAVFTPADGGTFTGEGITVTAAKGAVPDGQLLGVSATESSIPVPAPIPGARMTLAGSYYEVNGVQRNGEAPVSGYRLDDPISVCLPVPDTFRSDISDVVVVNRNPADGSLGILSSKVRQTDGGLVVCGSVGTLPATVAAAHLGIVEATPEPPQEPGIDDLSVGAATPGSSAAVWAMAIGAMMLATVAIAGITGIRRRATYARVGTHRDASAALNQNRANG